MHGDILAWIGKELSIFNYQLRYPSLRSGFILYKRDIDNQCDFLYFYIMPEIFFCFYRKTIMTQTSVLLVVPSFRRQVRLLGINYIAATLTDQKLLAKIGEGSSLNLPNITPPRVRILDLSVAPKNFDFAGFLKRFSPTIVGVSANTYTFRESVAIAKYTQRIVPDALRVIGGYHPSALPGESLLVGPFQVAVVGYGEETMSELAMAVHHYGRKELEEALSQIPGIAYKTAAEKVHNNGRRNYLLGLDKFPFPHTADNLYVFNNYRIQRDRETTVGFVVGSRGCPFRCKYCAGESMHNRRVRSRSAENILQEVAELIAQGTNYIAFYEEDFLLHPDPRSIIAGLKRIRDENSDLRWSIETRGDRLDSSLIKEMADAGLDQMALGIETGDEAFAREIKQSPRLSMATIVKNTEIAQAHRISVAHNIMVGLPGQDWASILQTARHLQDNPPDRIGVTDYEIFPGSQYFYELKRTGQGIGLIRRDGELITLMEHMTKGEILSALRDLEFLFYFIRLIAHHPEVKDFIKKYQIEAIVDRIRICSIYDLLINSRRSKVQRIDVLEELGRSTDPILIKLLEDGKEEKRLTFFAMGADMTKIHLMDFLKAYAETINLNRQVKRNYLDPFLKAVKFDNALALAYLPFSTIRLFIMIGVTLFHSLKEDYNIDLNSIAFEDEEQATKLIQNRLGNRTTKDINEEQSLFDWDEFVKGDSPVEFLGIPIKLDRPNNRIIII